MLTNILHQGLIDSLDNTVSNVHASILQSQVYMTFTE